jgi:hypothetical protein
MSDLCSNERSSPLSEKPQSHSVRMYLLFAGGAFVLGVATMLSQWAFGG